MPKVARINFKRITLSFPEIVVKELRKKIPKNKMSEYVAGLVIEDLEDKYPDADLYIESLRELSKGIVRKDNRDSLELLKEIRHG